MTTKPKPPSSWRHRTTRFDPPDLQEAVTAAQCLTDQLEEQIEIAAQLMGLAVDEVRPVVLSAARKSRASVSSSEINRRNGAKVVVERRRSRTV
jgi:hypothetical protein